MNGRRFGPWLSLLRQGFSIERVFGRHSLEALVSVAETIEESVYERSSLARTPDGVGFRLNNPPLRTGAFSAMRLSVDGVSVPVDRAHIRFAPGLPWRSTADISRERLFYWRPGDRVEFEIECTPAAGTKELRIRLELQSSCIPPLVWFEFRENLPEEAGA